MNKPRRGRIVAAITLLLMLLGLAIGPYPSFQPQAVATFDAAHYRVWRLGVDRGFDVPTMERQKFDFLVRLLEETIEPETSRFIEATGGLELTTKGNQVVVEEQPTAEVER